jgi:hypothetical protein
MIRVVLIAGALAALLVSPSTAAYRPDPSGPWWFKTQGGWAYCTESFRNGAELGILCVSTVSGRWIKIDDQTTATGRDPRYVGFHGPARRTLRGRVLDRPFIGDAWAICTATRVFLRCDLDSPNVLRFWMKPDGSYRIGS